MNRQRLSEAYDASQEPIYRIVDEDGDNVAEATLRHTPLGWVYQDEVDGFDLLTDADAAILIERYS